MLKDEKSPMRPVARRARRVIRAKKIYLPSLPVKKILLFGTFDILHPGHQSLFQQARRYGNKIIAVIARDSTVKKLKKHRPLFTERQRQKNLRQTGWADKILLGNKKDYFKIIKKIKPNTICLGYDQKFFIKGLKQKIGEWGMKIKIARLRSFHPKKYKSSKYARHKIHQGKSGLS